MSAKLQNGSTSLRKQVAGFEAQLKLRRQRVSALVTGAHQTVAAQLTSPGMLLAAVGVGVAVEQAGHHRAWSVAAMLEASHPWVRLLLTLASFGQQAGESVQRPGP